MPITLIPGGDPGAGQAFCRLVEELAYGMGEDFDFATISLPKDDLIILNPLCVDPARGAIPDGTVHKRSVGEFWSSFNVDYASFISGGTAEKSGAVRDALIGAASQVPTTRMPDAVKAKFQRSAENAATKLAAGLRTDEMDFALDDDQRAIQEAAAPSTSAHPRGSGDPV